MLRICSLFILALLAFPVLAEPVFSGRLRVIDGDTFDIGQRRVRVQGIDAPETAQTCETKQGAQFDCGAWVNQQVGALFEGKLARCVDLGLDRYGRTVARCTVGDQDIGRVLVQAGLAFAYRKYSMDYDLDEKAAAVNDRGLWNMRVESPAQFRKTRAAGRLPVDGTCTIKGNISSKGVRIYHMPGQADYERTGIRTEKGERWFCSEAEARAAGWRRAQR